MERPFKDSIKKETTVLRELDDILSELSMIRRVRQDAHLISIDWWDNNKDNIRENFNPVDRWAERGRLTLERLEDDAARVRKSVIWFQVFPPAPFSGPYIL